MTRIKRRFLETPGEAAVDAVIDDGLEAAVGDAEGQVGGDVEAEVIADGKIDLRAGIPSGEAGLEVALADQDVAAASFVVDIALQARGPDILDEHVRAGA